MGFSVLPPEINSARIYSGPGSGPLQAAATAWNQLAAELRSTAAGYSSAVSTLTSQGWRGPASMAMTAAVAPYIQWLTATATHAERTAAQAKAAANAYNQAFAMTVLPPAVAANRSQLAALVATNFLGQNTAAIAATEAHYGEMWAQDATAMESYSAQSTAASALPSFASPAQGNEPDEPDTVITIAPIRAFLSALKVVALDAIGTLIPIGSIGSFLIAEATFVNEYGINPGATAPPKGVLASEGGAVGFARPTAGLASGVGPGNGAGAVSAFAGRASSAGALSVPQGWSTPPEIRQLARALPLTSAAATPTAGPAGEESPYAGLGMASMAGGGMGGLAGLGASSANSAPTPATAPNVVAQKPAKPAANVPAASPVTIPSENVAENLAKTLAAMPGATVVVIPNTATPQ